MSKGDNSTGAFIGAVIIIVELETTTKHVPSIVKEMSKYLYTSYHGLGFGVTTSSQSAQGPDSQG